MTQNDDLPPLDSLERRIAEARRDTEPKPSPADAQTGKAGALRSGTELIAGIAVGTFLGYYADGWLGTRPACTIFGVFLGMAGGVMNIYRATSAEAAQIDQAEGKDSPAGSTTEDN